MPPLLRNVGGEGWGEEALTRRSFGDFKNLRLPFAILLFAIDVTAEASERRRLNSLHNSAAAKFRRKDP